MAPATEPRPFLDLDRIFDAPIELLWQVWTRPEMQLAWWGPVEWPAIRTEQDLRPGGRWRACLRAPDTGELLWQGGVFREVVPPSRLVFTFKWEGDNHEDGAPVDTLVTVDFAALSDGRTRMTLRHEGLKDDASLAGHRHGWTSTFDRLDAWIEQQGRKS